jgi:UDP-2-acetamido-2,6-beta-L-arabino-hexul-4-ose reductase
MRIVVTGGNGFIGKNLRMRLAEAGHTDVLSVTRATSHTELVDALAGADFVFHLGGVNRPRDEAEFFVGNAHLTEKICRLLSATGRRVPLALTSSTQAVLENAYGRSKREAEQAVERYATETGAPVFVRRLTNVFGKWAQPNHNSAVATFCHNLARGLPITVNDPTSALRLLYIDDVVDHLMGLLDPVARQVASADVGPVYETTVGSVAEMISEFVASRRTMRIPPVGAGLTRALYATFVSYLPNEEFTYDLPRHADQRGIFVEMLKTGDTGQFSFFTAGPGVTRGEHYHHTKTEKFLVVRGTARFQFRHVISGERLDILTDDRTSRVVETVPGWVHNISNAGADELIVLLWANEVFDPARPDTVGAKVVT